MKKCLFTILLILVFTLMSCATISVRTDYDHEADFDKYQTFKWMPDPKKRVGRDKTDSLLDKRIRRAVEREMETKGYRFVKRSKTDAGIVYHIAVRNKVDIDRYGYWGRRVHVRRYKEGSIIIDIVDTKTKELVWRGVAQGTVSYLQGDPERVNEAVSKIFEEYPPS
jgi:hypothetical protein